MKSELLYRYENFFNEELVREPTCSDVNEWGKLAIENCLVFSSLTMEDIQEIVQHAKSVITTEDIQDYLDTLITN